MMMEMNSHPAKLAEVDKGKATRKDRRVTPQTMISLTWMLKTLKKLWRIRELCHRKSGARAAAHLPLSPHCLRNLIHPHPLSLQALHCHWWVSLHVLAPNRQSPTVVIQSSHRSSLHQPSRRPWLQSHPNRAAFSVLPPVLVAAPPHVPHLRLPLYPWTQTVSAQGPCSKCVLTCTGAAATAPSPASHRAGSRTTRFVSTAANLTGMWPWSSLRTVPLLLFQSLAVGRTPTLVLTKIWRLTLLKKICFPTVMICLKLITTLLKVCSQVNHLSLWNRSLLSCVNPLCPLKCVFQLHAFRPRTQLVSNATTVAMSLVF